MTVSRRSVLAAGGLLALMNDRYGSVAFAAGDVTAEKPDYALRIATGLAELSPDHIVSTILYNASFQGRCCGSKRDSARWSTSTMTPMRRSWCIGTAR